LALSLLLVVAVAEGSGRVAQAVQPQQVAAPVGVGVLTSLAAAGLLLGPAPQGLVVKAIPAAQALQLPETLISLEAAAEEVLELLVLLG
jgi:hypothetical protein